MIGTLCSCQNAALHVCEAKILLVSYPYRLMVLCSNTHTTIFSLHWILGYNHSALLDEVIVREDEEVHKSSGAGSSLSCGGDEILQGCVESDGGDQVLLFNSQSS